MRLFLLVILLFQMSCYSDLEVVEGRIYSSPVEFQTSRIYPDSLSSIYLDTVDARMTRLLNANEDAEEAKEYFFLKKQDLLSKHCFFMMVENENIRYRVYFEESDFLKIENTEWFDGALKEVFIKIKAKQIRDYIYLCEEIIEI